MESRIGDVEMSGKLIGDLSYTKDSGHSPVLIIGHHILYGKVITLDNPLVIMKKEFGQEEAEEKDETGRNSTVYHVQSIIRKKLLFKTRPKPIIANVPKKI